jgi:hypothetical protein
MSDETYVPFDDEDFSPEYNAVSEVDVDEPTCTEEVTN